MTTEAVRRRDVTQATLNAWKERPFKWGKVDCVRMAACHLRRMGHPVKLPPSGSYGSLITAKRRLKERGYEDLLSAVDGMGLENIVPAAARPGDLLGWRHEDGLGSLGVCLGNGAVLAFHEDLEGPAPLRPVEFDRAWRVPVKGC